MPDPTAFQPPNHRLAYDCLVISDLHLGSAVCQAKLLEEFLLWAVENTRELVINGDIFDDLNFRRLTRRHFACLKIIRRHSDRDDFRLIWIRGNHDGPAEIVSHIVGVDFLDEHIYENGSIRLLILHGDQFDKFVTNYGVVTELACWIFYYVQKFFPHRAARWIRRVSKRFQRSGEQIKRQAIEYARARHCSFVTCGHTHLALTAESNGVVYINSGTWTETAPCPYVSVAGGDVKLEFWAGSPAAVDGRVETAVADD